jgi:hypothetical protein
MRSYSHGDGISLVSYGDNYFHLYGPLKKRLAFLDSVHASPRSSPIDSMTRVSGDYDDTWSALSLIFVPIELLECRLRDGL